MSQAQLQKLQQAFVTADKDGNSLLNKEEFREFVEIGYQKKCPDGMYENLCAHFKKDTLIGIDWGTARAVWLQAQQRATSPSPAPANSNSNTNNDNESTENNNSKPQTTSIKAAFIECDKDADGFLNKSEFHEFVKIGFKKPSCPDGMYEQVCDLFKKDRNKGLDWLSAYSLWKQSNPANNNNNNNVPRSTNKEKKKSSTPPPSQNKRIMSKQPPLNRNNTVAVTSIDVSPRISNNRKLIGKPSQLTPSKSTGRLFSSKLTDDNLRRHTHREARSGIGDDDDNDSIGSALSSRHNSLRKQHRTQMSNGRIPSFDDGTPDASAMVMQMMEEKVKKLSTNLKMERAKRKKTEELAQSILTQNENYKTQIADFESNHGRISSDLVRYQDMCKKYSTQLNDDRQTIQHLKQQRNAMQNDKDETFDLLTKLQKEHASKVKKLKQRHRDEMEKLSHGFLQSLGAEGGNKDVGTVIRELKANNVELQKQVDTLAETLARKQQSLLEALQAVDNIAMEQEAVDNVFYNNSHYGNNNNNSNNKNSKYPSPPKRRPSVDLKSQTTNHRNNNKKNQKKKHRATATFFKKATDQNFIVKNDLNISNVKNAKEMEFLSQQLTSDVANKNESIENLTFANNALVGQMQKMQAQMNKMKHLTTTTTTNSDGLP